MRTVPRRRRLPAYKEIRAGDYSLDDFVPLAWGIMLPRIGRRCQVIARQRVAHYLRTSRNPLILAACRSWWRRYGSSFNERRTWRRVWHAQRARLAVAPRRPRPLSPVPLAALRQS